MTALLSTPLGPRLIACCSYCDMELDMDDTGVMVHAPEDARRCEDDACVTYHRTEFHLTTTP